MVVQHTQPIQRCPGAAQPSRSSGSPCQRWVGRATAPVRHQMLEILDKYVKSPNSTGIKFPGRKKRTCPGKPRNRLNFKLSVPGISESPESKFPLTLFKNIPSLASRNPNGELSIVWVHSNQKKKKKESNSQAREYQNSFRDQGEENDPISGVVGFPCRDAILQDSTSFPHAQPWWHTTHFNSLQFLSHWTRAALSHITALLRFILAACFSFLFSPSSCVFLWVRICSWKCLCTLPLQTEMTRNALFYHPF